MKTNDDGSIIIEDQDLQNDTDEVKTEGVTDEDLKKDLQTTIAKKKAWREKAIDSESKKSYKELYEESIKAKENVVIEEKQEKKVETKDSDALDRIGKLEDESQKRVFQYANSLSPDQVNEVFAYAKGARIEPKEALEKPFMKIALTQMKANDENANASLHPSSRTPVQIKGKTFKDMDAKERKDAFSSFSKSR